MFYKPTFCCHCGEKISRAEESFADSTRFCDVCKHDFLAIRIAPMFFTALMMVIGLAGAGGLMRVAPPVPVRSAPVAAAPGIVTAEPPRNTAVNAAPSLPEPRAANLNRPVQIPVKTPRQVAPEEPLSVCGAPTKKGTPCSRKVRGGGRCWQHAATPDMPKAEKSTPTR